MASKKQNEVTMQIIRCRKTFLVRFANRTEVSKISVDTQLYVAIMGQWANDVTISLPITCNPSKAITFAESN